MGTFSEQWKFYHDLGWHPIPIRPGSKIVSEKECTGKYDDLTELRLQALAGGYQGEHGIAIRMPDGVIGIDVDAYPGKLGAETIALCEEKWGILPATFRSSARFEKAPVSGIRFYKIPPGTKLIDEIGHESGVEIIQRHHRYAVVYPSWNPKSESMYRWENDYAPNIDELPELPAKWVEGLKAVERKYATVSPNVEVTEELRLWTMEKAKDLLRELLATGSGGSRNSMANNTAFTFGQLVGRGVLSGDEVVPVLQKACEKFVEPEHWPYGDAGEVMRVIHAGIEAGSQKPYEPWPPILDSDSDRFFDKKAMLTKKLADAIEGLGPVAVGQDTKFWIYVGGVWKPGEKEVSRRITGLLEDRYRREHESNVKAYLLPNIPVIECAPVKDYINFKNCMVNWRTGETLEHNPKFKSTVQFNVNYTPTAECPMTDAFVESIMHPDAVKLYWQILGYLLMNGNPLHKAVLCLGSGRNGKGVTFRMLTKIVGANNVSSVTLDSLMDNRFSGADLFGKLMNIAGDIDATYQNRTATFKQITGEDSITAEKKFKDSFEFTPWAVPVFSANEQFGSADVTHGYVSRWIILEFPHQFDPSDDPGLEERIADELEGIAAKAISMLPELMSKMIFDAPESATTAKDKFIKTIDPLARFIEEECADDRALPNKERMNRVGTETAKAVLYHRYKAWCENEGARPLGRNKFYERLVNAHKFVEVQSMDVGGTATTRYYRGLRLTGMAGNVFSGGN